MDKSSNTLLSGYYQSKIDEYTLIKTNIEGLYSYFENCVSVTNAGILNNVDSVVINGVSILDSIDDGLLGISEISNKLNDCISKLGEIVGECGAKIQEYTIERDLAIARETAESESSSESVESE